MNNPVYKTERLLLRPTSLEDAALIIELFNSPKWLKYIGDRNVRTVSESEKYIQEKMMAQYERLGFSTFTVIRKTDLAKIGICGLYDREGLEGIDIGFAFLPQFEGRGYAIEATEKVKNLAFETFGIMELKAITTRYNFSSKKLLEKLGMKQTGTFNPEADKELLLYTLQKPE